jgi:carbonic anhydrase
VIGAFEAVRARSRLVSNIVVPAQEALHRLREGNQRYASNVRSLDSLLSHTRRADLATGQQPIAIILGCSDSRVPAEVVFDQGLGDLFVIRVAGNIVAPSQVGSVEFAAARFGTRLVVVMGHSQCGVIQATIETIENPGATESQNIRSIVGRVQPIVEGVMRSETATDRADLIHRAVRANVRASVDHLRHGSEVLERLIATDGLLVVGAEYNLETGEVQFFDGAD